MNLLTIISKKNYAVDGILHELWNYNIRDARCRIFHRGDELVIEIDEVLEPLEEDGGALGNFAHLQDRSSKVHSARRPTRSKPKRLTSIVNVKSEKITKSIFAMADIEHA